MKRLFLLIALLVIAFSGHAEAGKFWAIPECPVSGHATCSDGIDNDLDGTKDEAAPSPCIAAVTGGYAANLATCQLIGYTSTADGESDSGNMASKSTGFRVGQIGASGNFASGTYFIWLRARVAAATAANERAVWINTSPFTKQFDNAYATLLFTATDGVNSTMAWSKAGQGLSFAGIPQASVTNPNTIVHKSITVSGNATIYIAADGAVKFDCLFLSTDPDASPVCADVVTPAPQAGAITVSAVTTTGFTASWDFDTASTDDGDCFLNYGTTAGNLTSQSATASSTSGTCSRTIGSLASGTIYYMRGTSTNANGSTQTPQTQTQTSTQTVGPIRYAVPSGGSTTANCLTPGAPCTLGRALNQAVAGDTVQLADGTYTTVLTTVRSGTASQPITIKAENRHQAILSPQTSGNSDCVDIRHSYIVLKEIEVNGNNGATCGGGIRAIGTKGPPEVFLVGVVIEDNRMINLAGKAMFLGAVDGAIVRWNYINSTGLTVYNSSAGMYFGSYDGTSQLKNSQIYANEIYDAMTECFDIKKTSNSNDIHHNICQYSGRNGADGIQPISPFDNGDTGAVTFDGTSNVHNNIIKNYEVRPYAGCASVFNNSGTALFERNVCRDNTLGGALGGNSSGRATARNNTFCGLTSYATNGGGSTWTLSGNNGVPGTGAASSACDGEEARILSERDALPGNPNLPPSGGTDPVVYLNFNENTGTTAADSSPGAANSATLNNGATWATGKNGSGVSLDGVNDYVKLGTIGMSASTGTITFWVKPTSFAAGTHYFYAHTTLPAYASRIQLYFDDTGGNLDLGLGDTHVRATGLLDMAAGTWYHVGLTWDSGTWIVYVNGVQAGTGSYTGLAGIGGYQHIGNIGYDNQVESAGGAAAAVIDEFKIWNRALSLSDINEEYDIYK